MPIYEFVCQDCKKKFEELVRTMGGDARIACPSCGSGKTARALSVFAVGAEGSTRSSGGGGGGEAPPSCGRCGGLPGSCQA